MPRRGRKTGEELARAAPLDAAGADWACPGHLSGEAREAWDHIVSVLKAAGTLGRTDRMIVESYAVNVQIYRRAQVAIAKGGILLKGSHGGLVENPACNTANKAAMRLKSLAETMNLTPATSRAAASPASAPSGGKWGDLLGVVG